MAFKFIHGCRKFIRELLDKKRCIRFIPGPIEKKVLIYSLYIGENGIIPEYIFANERVFRGCGYQTFFIVTHHQSVSPKNILSEMALRIGKSGIIIRRNFGKDFASFKLALEVLGISSDSTEALILQNDSLIGPLYDSNFFRNFTEMNGDLNGLTESFDRLYHLQSSILMVKSAPGINALLSFFRDYSNPEDRELIIAKGEIGLTQFFIQSGLSVSCYTCILDMVKNCSIPKGNVPLKNINAQHHFLKEQFVDMEIPYLKREALSSNPTKSDYNYGEILGKLSENNIGMLKEALKFRA